MNGLNDFAENTEGRESLRAPFPAALITQVDKGFGPIDTVNHAVVTDRLNRVFPAWTTSEPRFIEAEVSGKRHVVAVVCSMTIGSVTRWEVGEVERASTYGDEAKKAMSDFTKRAAMRFGVGISLWTKADIDTDRATLPVPVPGESTARLEGAQAAQDAASPTLSVPGGADTTEGPGEQTGRADAPGPSTFDPDSPATQEQWHALLQMAGSKTKALNRINKANKVSYTQATSISATASELAAAISGDDA